MPDAEKAVSYFGPAFSNAPEVSDYGDKIEIGTHVLSSFGVVKSGIELHLLVIKHGEEVIYKMEETNDNYFRCSADVKLINGSVKFYFKAKDKRGYSTKFPSGIFGEYFILKKSHGKFKILN